MSSQINSLDDLTVNSGAMWAVLNNTDYGIDVNTVPCEPSGSLLWQGRHSGSTVVQSAFMNINIAIYDPFGMYDSSSNGCLFIKTNQFTRIRWSMVWHFSGGSSARECEVLVNSERIPGVGTHNADTQSSGFAGRNRYTTPPFSVSSGDQIGMINLGASIGGSQVYEQSWEILYA